MIERTALLVMDVQEGVVSRYLAAGATVVDRVAEAIALARAKEVLVVYVGIWFRPGHPEISPRNKTFSSIAGEGHLVGPEAASIPAAIAPRAEDVQVLKKRSSAFTGSDLEVVLRAQEVRSLVLTGIATSGVVLSTVRLGADLDYRLTVLSDACADSDAEVHRVLVEKIFPRQADVMTVAEWGEALR
jgi:nicotinamidase-related amidase